MRGNEMSSSKSTLAPRKGKLSRFGRYCTSSKMAAAVAGCGGGKKK